MPLSDEESRRILEDSRQGLITIERRSRARQDLLIYASIIDLPTRILGTPSNPIEPISDEERAEFRFIPRAFGRHHILWLNKLQEVAEGKIKRLMGLMPPGSAKSLYSSVCFPTYFLGRFPGSRVIVTNYGSDLPKKFGRWARSIVSTDLYRQIFGCSLSPEKESVDDWALTNGSEWYARGINAGITGNRADGIVWDDLVKSRQEADSKLIRDTTWAAYQDDLQTRRKPNCWEVGINTRWHEDDVPGRILPINYNGESGWVQGQDGNDWYVVCLPAECEREDDLLGRELGETLWPEYFSVAHLRPYRQNARTWSALFQQRPAPESGAYFEMEWFKEYGEGTRIPEPDRAALHVFGASDYATTDDGGNYTVHVIGGVDDKHNLYILDLWRARASSDKWVESFCDLAVEWRPMGWAEESGQIKAGVGPFLRRRCTERQIYVARAAFPTKGDKQVRAQSIRGRMGNGKVYFPLRKPWYPELKREMLNFPAGKTDDQVDAMGLLGQILDKMYPPMKEVVEPKRTKILSTNPLECTVTLDDVFEDNERHHNNKYEDMRIK